MAMPRVVSGTVPSASVFNTLAQEIDDLGVACTVRRTSTVSSVPTAVDQLVSWQAATFDTLGTMWSPAYPTYVTIRVPGTYLLILQERFSGNGGGSGAGSYQRAGKIMVNGTSVFSHSIASDKKQGDASGEGVTLSMTAIKQLDAGDLIYANYWSNHSGYLTALQADLGGTYLAVSRIAPIKL